VRAVVPAGDLEIKSMGVAPTTPGDRPQSHRKPKPFQPAIGREFNGVEEVEAQSRGFLARVVASVTALAVIVTGLYGLLTGNYTAVIAVWSVAGPIVGALVTYYFGPQRDTG
jgi:hypothetical protein